MELHILHLHGLAPRSPPRRLKHNFIIQSQPQFRHPAQITLQLHRP